MTFLSGAAPGQAETIGFFGAAALARAVHTLIDKNASTVTAAAARSTRKAGKIARDPRPLEVKAARRRMRRAGKAAARAALRD